jgi:hypothetical protein
VLGNFFAVGDSVFDMETDGVLDVCDRLFLRVSLAVTPVWRGARNKVALRIAFHDDRKRHVFHSQIIGLTLLFLPIEIRDSVRTYKDACSRPTCCVANRVLPSEKRHRSESWRCRSRKVKTGPWRTFLPSGFVR